MRDFALLISHVSPSGQHEWLTHDMAGKEYLREQTYEDCPTEGSSGTFLMTVSDRLGSTWQCHECLTVHKSGKRLCQTPREKAVQCLHSACPLCKKDDEILFIYDEELKVLKEAITPGEDQVAEPDQDANSQRLADDFVREAPVNDMRAIATFIRENQAVIKVNEASLYRNYLDRAVQCLAKGDVKSKSLALAHMEKYSIIRLIQGYTDKDVMEFLLSQDREMILVLKKLITSVKADCVKWAEGKAPSPQGPKMIRSVYNPVSSGDLDFFEKDSSRRLRISKDQR